jgi:hypothetical protein
VRAMLREQHFLLLGRIQPKPHNRRLTMSPDNSGFLPILNAGYPPVTPDDEATAARTTDSRRRRVHRPDFGPDPAVASSRAAVYSALAVNAWFSAPSRTSRSCRTSASRLCRSAACLPRS